MLVAMAWRNIWRNTRRSVLGIAAMAFSTGILLFLMAIFNGIHEQAVESGVTTYTGYIQINRKGYFGEKSLDGFIEKYQPLMTELKKIEYIQALTPRIETWALLGHEDTSIGCEIIGVDPIEERKVTILQRGIKEGRYLEPQDDNCILLGQDMAQQLGVKIGESIIVMPTGLGGTMHGCFMKVVGVFDAGSSEFNRGLGIVPLTAVASLIGFGQDKITKIVINLHSNEHMAETLAQIQRILADFKTYYRDYQAEDVEFERTTEAGEVYAESQEGIEMEKGFEVLTWEQLLADLVQFIILQDYMIEALLVIIFLAVFIIIYNIIAMATMERKREFGIMKAMGMSSWRLAGMIFLESLFMVFIAIAVGCAAGILFSMIFHYFPIPIETIIEIFRTGLLKPVIQPILSLGCIIKPIVLVVLTALYAPLIPIWGVSRLTPMVAIHSV